MNEKDQKMIRLMAVIDGIMAKYSEESWMEEIKKLAPDETEEVIMSIIEFLSGGDDRLESEGRQS